MDYIAKIADGGRIVLPLPLRKKLGVEKGDELILREDNGAVQLFTYRQRLEKFRALVNARIPEHICLTDRLREMRQQDTEQEMRD